jgi:hypothetical protein
MREPGDFRTQARAWAFALTAVLLDCFTLLSRSNDRDILLCFRLTVDQLLFTVRGAAFRI